MSDKVRKNRDTVSRKWLRIALVIFAAVYSVKSIFMSYLNIVLSSDVLYSDTVLPVILDYVGELLELGAIAACYAVMICILYRCGKQGVRPLFALFALATAYKYLANMTVLWVISGSIPSSWIMNIVDVLYYTALEFFQLVIVYLIIRPVIERYRSEKALAEKKLSILGEDCGVSLPSVYPLETVYDKNNCLCRSAYFCSVVIFIAKLSGDVISDLWMILSAGLPNEWVTWVLMAVNYLSKVIFAGAAYFIIYAAVSFLLKDSEEAAK